MNPMIELAEILRSPIAAKSYSRSDLIDKELILYGAGSMGRMALDLMRSAGIEPSLFVDQSAKGSIGGVEVLPLNSLSPSQKQNALFVICVVTVPLESIALNLRNCKCMNVIHFYDYSEIFFPDLMGNGWKKEKLLPNEIDVISRTIQSLDHDEQSSADYLRYLWWRLRRVDMQYDAYPVSPLKKYFLQPAFPELGKNEIFVDAGAHHGELSKEFIKIVDGFYSSIHAFEPDNANYERVRVQECLSDDRVKLYKLALDSECINRKFINGMGYASRIDDLVGDIEVQSVTLDSLRDIQPTIIKLHIEGGEYNALLGAANCIEKNRPIIMVVADHNQDGIYSIPEFLMNLNDYRLHFTYNDFCGNTSIFYAYPTERAAKL
jgi:FkbM family methyltransferase